MTQSLSSARAGAARERVPIASDHAGCQLRGSLVALLTELGFEADDMGPNDARSVDYPDFAHPLAARVASGDVARGILLCGTGLGMSYAANRHAGVRAAIAWTPEIARLSREHNDANILILPARFVSDEEGREILRAWMDTAFEGGRHQARVDKIELRPTGARVGGVAMLSLLADGGAEDEGDGRGCGTHEPGTGGT